MASVLFRNPVIEAVNSAIKTAQSLGEVEHNGLRGRFREIVTGQIFGPFLAPEFNIGSGNIVDSTNTQSAETDLIIYSKSILPPILFGERDGHFPVESSLYAIEVKSKVTATEIADAVVKAKKLLTLRYRGEAGNTLNNGGSSAVIPAFFAFGSDLAGNKKTELQRYCEYDQNANTRPLIPVICVVGKGYWWFQEYTGRWVFQPPTDAHDEVIDFLSGILNSLPELLKLRGKPAFGHYVMQPREIEYL